MQPDNILRARRHGGNLVNIQGRCIGRQNRARFADFIEIGENLLFQAHILKHSLNHQIAISEFFHLQHAANACHARIHFVLRKTPAIGRALIIAAHHAQAAGQRVFLGFDNNHLNAGRGEIHRNAAAHGSGTDNADFLNRPHWHIIGQSIDDPRLLGRVIHIGCCITHLHLPRDNLAALCRLMRRPARGDA